MVTEIHIFNRKIEEVQQRIVELFTEDENACGEVSRCMFTKTSV